MPTNEPFDSIRCGNECLAERKVPVALSRMHALELVDVLHAERRQRAATARVGDHAVERAGGLGRGGDDALDVALAGDVADHVADAAAVAPAARSIFSTDACQRGLGAPADGDRGAVGGGHARARGADAGAAAGDEHAGALQTTGRLQLCRHASPPHVPASFVRNARSDARK